MLSHKNFSAFISALIHSKSVHFKSDDVVLSYLPLPHVLEREIVYGILYVGGKVVYSSGNVKKIKEDLAVARPTIFVSVPRLLNRFY